MLLLFNSVMHSLRSGHVNVNISSGTWEGCASNDISSDRVDSPLAKEPEHVPFPGRA